MHAATSSRETVKTVCAPLSSRNIKVACSSPSVKASLTPLVSTSTRHPSQSPCCSDSGELLGPRDLTQIAQPRNHLQRLISQHLPPLSTLVDPSSAHLPLSAAVCRPTACPWPPPRRPFLAGGGKDWQEKDPARALPTPGGEVSSIPAAPSLPRLPRGDPKRFESGGWTCCAAALPQCRGHPSPLPSPASPGPCLRPCAPCGRERACYITLLPLPLGVRWGRSLMTRLPPPAHHLVAHPLFSSHLLCPSLGEAKESSRPPQRAPLVSVPPFLFSSSCWLRPLFCSLFASTVRVACVWDSYCRL